MEFVETSPTPEGEGTLKFETFKMNYFLLCIYKYTLAY